MTDSKPTTLSIDQSEWRVLFADNVQRMVNFVQGAQALTADDLPKVLAHLERAAVIARAWCAAAVPAVVEPASQATNGADKPKRGWPKGKKRNGAVSQAVQ